MAVSDQSVATGTQLDQLCINTIRTLSMDAVQESELGPSRNADGSRSGRLLSLAAVFCAMTRKIRSGRTATASCSPTDHASMLLYSLLHLAGRA